MRRAHAHLLCTLAMLAACASPEPDETASSPAPEPPELYTDDLDGIRRRGTLRVLVETGDERHLPRSGDPLLHERELAARFAEAIGVEMKFVTVDTFSHMLPALERGLGDLVAANLTVTEARADSVSFSIAVDHATEHLVLPAEAAVPDSLKNLEGTLGVRAGTSFEQTAQGLSQQNPRLQLDIYSGAISSESLVDSVTAGAIDYTIEDSNRLDIILDYRDDVRLGPAVSERRPLAWAVRSDSRQLREALDDFLHVHRILGDDETTYVEDLPELKTRRRLRMITHNSATTYFLWRGRLMGFEYELAKRFAKEQGLRLEVTVAHDYSQLLPMLRSGNGDFVAAFLTPLASRQDSLVTFTNPYYFASEVLVGPSTRAALNELSELAGARIAVRPSSSYRQTLESIRAQEGIEFDIVDAPESMETEAIIAAVADGRYDLTVADSHILEMEMTLRDDVRGLIQLSPASGRAWAVQPANAELKEAMNQFLEREYRSAFYNMTYDKYFARARRYVAGSDAPTTRGHLSPYDELVRELAPRFGYDWRLIVSQMYQESQFDPQARSWAGAMGLMQLMPETARELGVTDIEDPRQSIEAGLRHLFWLWARFPQSLETDEHMWFVLASYNAGHGHVRDARRLARALKLDPDVWFENVETAMLRLSEREYFRQARHGYVRGSEPVEYVRAIRGRYRAYVELLETDRVLEEAAAGD